MRGLVLSRVAVRVVVAVTAACWSWAAGAAVAGALTVAAPAQVLRSVDVTVTLGSGEPTGTVALAVDGVAVRTATVATVGGSVRFPSVRLAQGVRTISATLTDGAGRATSSSGAQVTAWDWPEAPALVRPTGDRVAAVTDVVVRAGRSTSSLRVVVNGVEWGVRPCTPGSQVVFPNLALPAGTSFIWIVASNPYGERSDAGAGFVRLDYPASTCIVISKSEYRLYWIQNDILVKTYRVAIGKRRTQTPNAMWIVGRKEYMPPSGVYGPRRLKLARLVSYRSRRRRFSRYRMTGFGIHGTNQPWVIGTMASHGCIRLTNDQILDLWPQVPLGTVVQTRP